MKKNKHLVTLALLSVVILGLLTFLKEATHYIGRDYFDSSDFVNDYFDFQQGLERYVLNELDVAEIEKNITVSDEEIEYYRNYYGTLSEQIANIREQYAYELDEDAAQDEAYVKALEAERNAKIEEIQKNFDSDDVVREKILAAKKVAVQNFLKEREQLKRNWQSRYSQFTYDFKDEETGEEYKNGDVTAQSVFKQTFGPNNSVFNSDAVNRSIYVSEYNDFVGALGDSEIELYFDNKQFTGTISIPKSKVSGSNFAYDYHVFQKKKIMYYALWALTAISLVLLATKLRPTREMFELAPKLRNELAKWPIDVRIAVWFVLAIIAYGSVDNIRAMISNIAHTELQYFTFIQLLKWVIRFAVMAVFVVATIASGLWLVDEVRDRKQFMLAMEDSFTKRFVAAAKDMYLNRTIGKQNFILLSVIFAGGFGLGIVVWELEAILIYVPLFIFIFLPVLFIFMRRMGYLNRMMKQTKDMAEGRLTSEVEVKGKSPLAEHAANLNALREGVRSSMNEQAKSERMKTELITNVSHDLRTPLTSIITYTDLLKNPELSAEERTKYIAILDAKSARLKTLIEDLFEVSKMASGNVELYKQRVDLAQLLQQGIGEHEEDFANAGLDLRVDIHDKPIYAYVDGQKWWRVLDNVIVNARKYSLEGTRVYVQLRVIGDDAHFIVKNVAKYELAEDVAELTERFKRGDASRHTDGSGLGLAIAQSIVDLHNGRLKIDVDGDLFKVTVTVPKIEM